MSGASSFDVVYHGKYILSSMKKIIIFQKDIFFYCNVKYNLI